MEDNDDYTARCAALSSLEEEIKAKITKYNLESKELKYGTKLGLISGYEGDRLRQLDIFTPETYFDLDPDSDDGWYSSGCSF